MPESATILFVDDEAVVRRVLGDALQGAGFQVRLAGSADEALAQLRQAPIDVLLLDLQLGDDDGLEVMREARRLWPQLPIVILTAHGSLPSAIEALRHEVADYLLKPISVDELRRRVSATVERSRAQQQRQQRMRALYDQLQAVLEEDRAVGGPSEPAPPPAAGAIYRSGPLTIDVQQHTVRMAGQIVELTPTEFTVLHELVRQPGVVLTCAQLVDAIQHIDLDEEEARQVMRPHIVRLRRKIEPNPQQPIYIQSVRGIGYRWGPFDEDG